MKNVARTIFQNNEMLRHLNADAMDKVALITTRGGYKRGSMIFASGDPGDAIYGVISGKVQITARTPANHQIFLDLIGPGDVFGEIAVIDGRSRCATAVAATDVDAFRIPRDAFARLMAIEPLVSLGLLNVLCDHQRVATQLIIEEYAQTKAEARLAHGVLRLTNDDKDAGCQEHPLQMTQAELAKFVFVSRQVVNQHLRSWENRGWVSMSRRRLVVTNRDALVKVAKNLDS
jgi:CRP-like cAMP-binding protein